MAGKPWNAEARARWGQRQRDRNAAIKAGLDPDSTGGAGGGDRGGGVGAGARPASLRRDRRDDEGGNLLGADADKNAAKKKPGDDHAAEPVIDVNAVKEELPGYLEDYYQGLDELAQNFQRAVGKENQRLRVRPLTPEGYRADGNILAKLAAAAMPFLEKHPVLAGLLIVGLRPFIRVRWEKIEREVVHAQDSKEEGKKAGTV